MFLELIAPLRPFQWCFGRNKNYFEGLVSLKNTVSRKMRMIGDKKIGIMK